MSIDLFEEYDDNWEPDSDSLQHYRLKNKARRKTDRKLDSFNAVEVIPPLSQEILDKRKIYENDYALAHMDLFKESTGIKPLSQSQIDSSNHSLRILNEGGKLLKLEPRGFGKTSRTSNEVALAALQGKRKYILVLASSQTKAAEILDSIATELATNDKLYELYPQECECFRHLDDNPARAKYQSLDGNKTFIRLSKDTLVFPCIPGSECSGSIIKVRTKDNVRGTFVKVKEGPFKGSVLRPDCVFMDDLQTDEDAENPKTVKKIVTLIKKSVLRSGGHASRMAVIFAATPICSGDVPHHFYFEELSWEYVSYKMMKSLPERMDMWLGEYKRRYMNFDRSTPGSKTQAALYALQYYKENKELMQLGAHANWDWCYEWKDDPLLEIDAIQHAMNILIEEGEEVFRSECQTELSNADDIEGFKRCPMKIIASKQSHNPRFSTSVEVRYIVSHIDVQKRYLTYVTCGSGSSLQPEILDYNIFPRQTGMRFSKRNVARTLEEEYPDVPESDIRIYLAVKDLTERLGEIEYRREDGVILKHNLITCDSKYETHKVRQALRDSRMANICMPHIGLSVKAADRPIAIRSYGEGCEVHHECVTIPVKHGGQLALHSNINYMKTEIHKGFLARQGLPGSIQMFKEEYVNQHDFFAEHLWAEKPKEDFYEKEKRVCIVWEQENDDNEYFDNLVGCFAGFLKLGCVLRRKKSKARVIDMQDFINQQKDDQ